MFSNLKVIFDRLQAELSSGFLALEISEIPMSYTLYTPIVYTHSLTQEDEKACVPSRGPSDREFFSACEVDSELRFSLIARET